ncbi:hypothetical protein MMC07_005449 [Pseudocyphellaria aurata]|nr:hypothetical protein [Pseudocyphellaria aurata]
MDFGFLSLPAETVAHIIQCLPKKDIKNVRLVSKNMNVIATRFLFESLIISTCLKDRENFTAISQHPVFSQLVKEVVHDSTHVTCAEGRERFALSRASYTRFLFPRMNATDSTGVTSRKCSKASIHRGYKIFAKNFHDQAELAWLSGDDLTNPLDVVSRPANFASLLMDPQNHRNVAKHLPDDLVRLVHGLPRMPKVRRFVITDCRYSKDPDQAADSNGLVKLSATINNQGVRGKDEVILNPRPWLNAKEVATTRRIDRSWYRGFFVLTQAISMTHVTTVKSFKVERNSITSGLSGEVFDMSPRELFHAANAFRNLTTVQLKIQTGWNPEMATRWQDTMARGDLAQILGAATHLKFLDLRMEAVNPYPIHFARLISTHTWPNLHKFTLARVALVSDGEGFLEFFERHRDTLRGLWLEEVVILNPGQAQGVSSEAGKILAEEFATSGRDPAGLWSSWSIWNEILGAMGRDAVALDNITFFENNFSPRFAGWIFHSCNPPAVFDFLRSRGVIRPSIPCQHKTGSFWHEEDR